jgi:hypothetical protein
MKDLKFVIYVTAHDPLANFDNLLETLRGYQELPGAQDVFIYIDWEHRSDKSTVLDLLESNLEFNKLEIVVAGEEWVGFTLTWAHKKSLLEDIKKERYDLYIYTENDMLFRSEHFLYWYEWKDKLKKLNLEPGFCRFERYEDKFVPFDNHRVWQVNGPTRRVWGDRPYNVSTVLTPLDNFICFASLGNPYMGMMILDQDMADTYAASDSSDPVKSFKKVDFRCWPIADRSSLGTAFEGLLPGQEHRRVVPLIESEGKLLIPPYALLEHRDTKYSKDLQLNSVLDISQMFGTSSS